MMKPITILFDASFLLELEHANSKGAIRSGIYWVAYNILKQFKECSFYNVILFATENTVSNKGKKIDSYFSSFPCITFFSDHKYRKNIEVHKNEIKKTKNFLVIIIRFLKIIKNIVLLINNISLTKFSLSKLKKVNIFFSPMYTIPDVIKNISSIKCFHLLYDCVIILFKNYYNNENHWFNNLLRNLNKETFYFCISECTKTDFLKNASEKLDKDKMFVTPISTSQTFYPNYDKVNLIKVLLKYNVTQKPDECYLFSLCNIEPRKNLIFTINCFLKFIEKNNIKNMYFYLGGGRFPDFYSKMDMELSHFSEYQNKVIQLGYIDDSDVNVLYSNSLFFTYLSEYEGFGMPPLEAMQAGTPVICSNNSSLPEVVGDAAITITYNDENACIKAFEDFYFNENLRKEYIARGLERAKLFSWEKTFKMMSDIIIDTLKE